MRTSLRVLAILAAVAAALSGVTPPRSQAFAVTGAIQWSGNVHWYKRYSAYPSSLANVDWHEAKKAAESLGGHLVTITSREEDLWVYSNFVGASQDNTMTWMGASDEANEG